MPRKPTRAVRLGWLAFHGKWALLHHWIDLFAANMYDAVRDGKVTQGYIASVKRIEDEAKAVWIAAREYRVALEKQEGRS